jgi:hypothetical protein
MSYLHLIFLVLALVSFFLKGVGVGHPKADLGWLGLAFLTLALWLHP